VQRSLLRWSSPKVNRNHVVWSRISDVVVVTGKDETPDIEDLELVLRDSSIHTLRL
jgi:hypothetical protein